MSSQSYLFNPTERTLAAAGDGFSCPRLTTAGRTALSLTAGDKGMMVYDTTLTTLCIWNGSAWELTSDTGTSSDTEVLFNDNGSASGNTAMVFNKTTDTLTVQNLNVTGAFTALSGFNSSAIRAAASDYAAVTFDGATASTRITSTLTSQNIGTGDFSLWSRLRVPPINPSANCSVIGLSTTSSVSGSANSTRLSITSTGDLLATFQDGTGALTSGTVAGFISSFSGQAIDLFLVRTATTLKIYINGTDTPYTGSPTFTTAITSTYLQVGIGSGSTAVFPGRIYRSAVFNRALSAGDVAELITLGVNPADQWGTQTGQTSGTLVTSKRYRITTYVSSDSFTNVGAASNATGVEFVATGTTPTTWTNASTLNRIGAIVDLDFTVGAGYQATDRSTNRLNGTLFNGVSWTMPETSARLYATTAFTGNSQMLGTLAIPTNAIIEYIVVYTTGISTVFVGNASGDNSIVGATAITPGYNRLTLSAFLSSTGNLWVNCSQPDTLRFTIIYSIAQP